MFQKSGWHLKIPSARTVTSDKFHIEDPHALAPQDSVHSSRSPGARDLCIPGTEHNEEMCYILVAYLCNDSNIYETMLF
jgi:hypothetical protein